MQGQYNISEERSRIDERSRVARIDHADPFGRQNFDISGAEPSGVEGEQYDYKNLQPGEFEGGLGI
jgi:hypothetical protein